MFKFPDWCYRKLPSTDRFWISLWLIWLAVLWWLSSGTHAVDNAPKIPHLDKVAHFCYFMAGGFCLANFLYLRKLHSMTWKPIIVVTLIIGSIVGAIDELHQAYTPGRTGCDPADWAADVFGTLAGAYYCYFMWLRLKKKHSLEI